MTRHPIFHHRKYDNMPCRKLWEAWTPWAQIVGWLIVLGSIGGGLITTVRASASTIAVHEERITTLESNYRVIDQKLDDLIQYEQRRK